MQTFDDEYSRGITEALPSAEWDGSFSLRPRQVGAEKAFVPSGTIFVLGGAVITPAEAWLGSLAPGHPADILVLERRHPDAYESVALADPSWVQMVLIGGDICYCMTDWYEHLVTEPQNRTTERLTAWGKAMTIDTGFQSWARSSPDADQLSHVSPHRDIAGKRDVVSIDTATRGLLPRE